VVQKGKKLREMKMRMHSIGSLASFNTRLREQSMIAKIPLQIRITALADLRKDVGHEADRMQQWLLLDGRMTDRNNI
jgi:hypothetical protein